jgi:hypothetical protein
MKWFRACKEGIINLYNWFLIIFQDRQFDYYFLLKVIYFKLDLMVKYREAKRHCQYVNDDKDLETLRLARDACKRLIDDKYWLVYNDFYEIDKAIEKDTRLLFDTMRDNMYTWWD